MKVYLIKRLVFAATAIVFLATILFVLFRMFPADPTMSVLTPAFDPGVIEALRHRFGLDKPLTQQYFIFMKNMLRGQFGVSFQHGINVYEIIAERFWNTMALMLPSLFSAYLLGIVIGTIIGWRRGKKTEVLTVVGSIVFRSGPVFWVAIIFIYIFSIKLGIFPLGYMRTPGSASQGGFGIFFSIDFLHHLLLPMLVMTLYYGCYPLLIMRTSILEVLGEDYIDLAKAKGLSRSRVIFSHAMRTSLLPIATSVSLLGAFVMSGSVLIETVFSWPGIGRLMVTAVMYADYPLAQATFLIIGTLVIVGNLFADILYGILDPRITYR